MSGISFLSEACGWAPSYFLVISENVYSPLLYYSYFGAVIPSLILTFFVYFHDTKFLKGRLLLATILSFSLWSFCNLVTWATEYPSYTMFFWTILVIVEPLIYFFAFYFFFAFIYERDFSLKQKIIFLAPLLPTMLLAPTMLGLSYFDLTNCDRAATEGVTANYGYALEFLYALLIIIYSVIFIRKTENAQKTKVTVILSLGLLAFLLSLSAGNILEIFTENWYIGQYGLFGAPVFVAIIAYLIVRHKAFNIKLAGAQALIFALAFLIATQFFYSKSFTNTILNAITLLLTLIAGYFLILSVKKEVERKEELQKLSDTLAKANDRLEELDKQKSEFISIASHQLRTPLTAIRGYISLALEGAYGKVKGTPIEDIMNKMYTIDLRLSQLVEDLLNVSKIEAGKVQYKWESVTLDPIVSELYDMFAVLAEKKGLKLHMIKPETQLPVMKLDINKIKEILSNLIDNAIKYTEKGSVTIRVEQDATVARVVIEDTGIGISKEDALRLFGKFIRTETTQKMDAGGSGLGLFVGKTFVEGHGGRVYATSEGVGKGSSFIVELPLINPNAS